MLPKFLRQYFEETTDGGNGAAPVTAPAAPATPPVVPSLGEPAKVDAVTPDPKTPGPVEDAPFEYNQTGNPTVDYALGVIGKAGISNEHPAALAAFDGDFTLLRAVLAQKGVSGANELVGLLEAAAKQDAENDAAVATAIEEKVHAMAGGKEHWDVVQAWGAENADDAEKETLNGLFLNKATAHIAAAYLLQAYDAAGGVKEGAARAAPAGDTRAVPAASQAGPLTRQEFSAASQELYKKMGDSYINSPEYQALGRRLQR